MQVGECVALSAELMPEQIVSEEIVWETSGNAATVDSSGVVNAVKTGESDIKAYLKSDTNIYAVCKVEVVKDSVELETRQTAVEANGDSVTQTSPSSPTKSANTDDVSGQKAGFWFMIAALGIILLRNGRRAVL